MALRLAKSGEVPANAPSYPDALRILDRQNRELDGYRLRCANLEEELADRLEDEAPAGDVRDVLEHHRDVLMPKAKIVAASLGWRAVKARLKHFEVVELKAVVEGARRSSWHCAARYRLTAKFLFRDVEAVEELRDIGWGVEPRVLRNGLLLSRAQEEKLGQVAPNHFFALDVCDCGHLRLEHGYAAPPLGFQRCLHGGCECEDFDDFHSLAEAWKAERRAA